MSKKSDDLKKKVDVNRETIEQLVDQIKGLIQGVSAEIDDYRLTVTTMKEGIGFEFFVKAMLKKK